MQHCQSRIRRWEVWNEPPNFTGKDQTPADYAKLVVAAYDAAKAVDPGCQIGLAAKSSHLNDLARVIKAGARDHFDYITLHPYEILGTVAAHAGTGPIFMNIVPSVRKMPAAQNPATAGVPIIFTELGHDLSKGAEVQAQVKACTTGFKTAGHWFTIPDNKEWHTARFRLDDPQFANYWGYNFALESDGNTYQPL